MNLRWRLLTTHLTSAGIGVAAAAVGFLWGPGVAVVLGAVVAAAISGALAFSVAGRFQQELSLVDRALEAGDLETCPRSGLAEINEHIQHLRGHVKQWVQATTRARQQMCEVEGLLAQLDRRSGTRVSQLRESDPARQLRHLLGSLAKGAAADLQRILTCIDQIERRTDEMSAGVREQANAVGQTTSSVEQMSAQIDSISQSAEAANKAAATARESAAEGLQLVRQLMQGMDRIRLQVDAGSKKLRALGDRSQEIGSIVGTIGAISARTDMLALNASIESVRAGEHGRGFAVVADEVRKLAEQTAQATREVTSLIESIQVEIQESTTTMAEEHEQVEAEVRRVNESSVALERISKTSSDSAERVGEISRATLHQLRLTQELVLAMQHISEAARKIRGRAEDVCYATRSLREHADQLSTSLSPLPRYADTMGQPNAFGADVNDEPDAGARPLSVLAASDDTEPNGLQGDGAGAADELMSVAASERSGVR